MDTIAGILVVIGLLGLVAGITMDDRTMQDTHECIETGRITDDPSTCREGAVNTEQLRDNPMKFPVTAGGATSVFVGLLLAFEE